MNKDHALLAIQQCLLGEVSACLRALTLRIREHELHFDCYFDGPINEEDVESMSCVETELIAALPQSIQVSHAIHRIDSPAELPKHDTFVFFRRE